MSNQITFGGIPRTTAMLLEIGVLADDREAVITRMIPDVPVVRQVEAELLDVSGARVEIREAVDQLRREILIEQQPYAEATSICRSRSAAKARQARISSMVR